MAPAEENSTKSVFIMRHGERIDFTFSNWVEQCFDEFGVYKRKDLNMPNTLPDRQGGSLTHKKDAPLTKVGIYGATLVGEALRDQNIIFDQVYSSPTYRCVQTSDALLKALNQQDLPIKIEPGMFEYMSWYPPEFVPDWMTPNELTHAGFNIDENYSPIISEKNLKESNENIEEFYHRKSLVAKSASAASNGNVLLVGHSSSFETCSRGLMDKPPRVYKKLLENIKSIPYCALIQLKSKGNSWELIDGPCLPLTHSIYKYDYKELL